MPRSARLAPRLQLDTLGARLLLLVGLATLPALAFIPYAASRERSSARRGAEAHAMVLARLAAEEHARQIRAARGLLVRLAPLFAAVPAGEVGCPDVLPVLVAAEPRFANLGALAPTGRLTCSAVPPPHRVDFSKSSALTAALASHDVVVGDYQIGPVVERPVLLVAVAARNTNGTPRAVPFVALDLRWLHALVDRAGLPHGSVVTIFDRQGRVLARSADSKRWTGRTLPERVGFRRASRRREGVFDGPGVDGVHRLWAFHRLGGVAGVWVTVGIPTAAAFADAQRAQLVHIAGFALVLLCAVVMGVAGAELSVLRGVRSVTLAARRLAAGQLGARAPAKPGAFEIQELALAFDAMASALELRQRQSEETGLRLRALAARIQTAREDEAARIARELHDEVGQALTALKLDIAWIGRPGAAAQGAPEAAPHMATLVRRIDDTISVVRRLSQELRPAILDRLGLAEALDWQARELEARAGVRCTVDASRVPSALDPQITIAAFRIIQEALTNVVRHARAQTVTIRVEGADGLLSIEVRDDGEGAEAGRLEGVLATGIQGMRERAQLLGGSLFVDSVPSGGTTVRARLPLSRSGDGAVVPTQRG